MNKLFTKIAALCLGATMAVGVGVAVASNNNAGQADAAISSPDDSITFQDVYSANTQLDNVAIAVGDSTVTFNKRSGGTPTQYYTNGYAVRWYGGGTLVVSSSKTIEAIDLRFGTGDGSNALSVNTGTWSSPSWTGSSTSVTFTQSGTNGNRRIAGIDIKYSGGGGGGGEQDPVLQSIAVSGEKTEYTVGDEFVKPTVTATYDKGDPQNVTADATCTGYNMGVAGNYTVTVSYGGKTTTYDIVVNDAAPTGDELYTATFTDVETHSYTQNKEFTLNGKNWVASVSQVNGGVFYLGCNSSNAAKGILNNNSTFADVVTVLAANDTPYNNGKTSAHAYALLFDNAYECVGSVEFAWAGGNNAFQVYLFGDHGDGYVLLAHTNYGTSGTTTSGSVKWEATDYGENFERFAIVARPGATGSTATNKTLRAASFKIVKGEDEPGLKTMTIKQSGTAADGQSYNWKNGTYTFEAYDDSTKVTGVEWSTSNAEVATINASTGALTPVKPGSVIVYAEAEDYKKSSAAITINAGTVSSVAVSGSMNKTAYYVGEAWSNDGLTATVTYSTGYSEDGTADATWTYNPASPTLGITNVVATATFGGKSGSSSTQTVTVSKTNPIQVLYTMASDAPVDVYGYYVGFLDGTGPVIMNGAYGIVIYNKSADVSGYTEGETILHVTGNISIFHGLYEIGSASMSIASGTYDTPDTPIVYSTTGSETADYASRLTTVTGTPSLVSGSFDDAAGTADIKMNFAVGDKTVQVYYKTAAQTADAEAFAAIKDAVANSSEITIKGFTGWFDGFQVQMNGYVKPSEDYTAEDFAQDLLDDTDAVCEGYEEGDNNHDALVPVWNNLAVNKYTTLSPEQKAILSEAEADEGGDTINQALARYEYLCARYGLAQFILGHDNIPTGRFMPVINAVGNNVTIIIIIAAMSATAIGGYFFLRKRKDNY